ncbi:MAG: 30S ribosomal protein S12 methylthiotransferase RimO [Chloroflexi bacterium]|nr:30S ribosomal protein S12 methylthiotransferase RimO [Chloroflexota bacterium]
MSKRKDSYYLLSLGCSKNTVDSQSMAALLDQAGMRGTDYAGRAEVLIVNTCGFIESARQESIDALRELAAHKRPDQYLIAAGCLSQRFGHDLPGQIPQLDGVIGTRRWMDIVDLVRRLRDRKHPEPIYHLPDEAITVGMDERGVSRVAVQGPSAYLKIADGCRRPCAFCAIPAIKGTAVSRPVERILAEARQLRDQGVKELILIAQDTTDYGHDLGVKDGLAALLEQLVAAVPDVPWIRIMYAYPGYVTDHLIETMASHRQIVPYLDMPLQHADHRTLLRMRRPANVDWVQRTVAKMRSTIPNLAIRTTFIVGYPGETDEEFDTLLNFVREMQFDRVGCFTYSFEPGTPSADQPGQVEPSVMEDRRDRLMSIQQPISLARNQALIGRTLDVLVEGHAEATDENDQPTGQMISLARSYRDAPEIDGYVLVEGELPAGEIVPVRVTGAMVYDLVATPDLMPHTVIAPGTILGPQP